MSAVAALAVASPVAGAILSGAPSTENAAPQEREFVQATLITDLPNELLGALSQGLSQFGINLPPLPMGVLTGSGAPSSTTLTPPGLTSSGLTGTGLTAPGLTPPGLTPQSLTPPGLTSGLTPPGLTTSGATPPGLATPGLTVPPVPATGSPLTDASVTNPALTNQGLTNPTLTSPVGALPGLTSPSTLPSTFPSTGEVPIADPIGTYPILGGDPSLAMPTTTDSGSGGLLGDLSSAAETLGAGQAIDLLKGMLMPMITGAIQSAAAPAAAAIPAPA